MSMDLYLKNYFGYDNFRSGQREIISSILKFRDTLAILPTGGGKSICYQVPGLILPGATVVVSPLISLMQDQVDALNKKKIPAIFLNSSLSHSDLKEKLSELKKYKFIYVAPERLMSQNWLSACKKIKISQLAVDEAHCIAQWGHDFRPSYFKISRFIKTLKKRPIITALTATATPQTQAEIASSLQMKNPQIFKKSFARNNLSLKMYNFETNVEKEISLFKILTHHKKQSGIIYTQTRAHAEYISQIVNHLLGEKTCLAYHAGLGAKLRSNIQKQFVSGRIKLIAATNAFGMGIDKSNVRFVIHFGPPGSIENYYQEVGRAGRDGNTSSCYLLMTSADKEISRSFLDKSQQTFSTHLQKLNSMFGLIDDKKCKMTCILDYFGELASSECKSCNNCQPQKINFTDLQSLIISRLLSLRQIQIKKSKIHKNQFMTDQTIAWVSLLQPKSESELLKVPGIGTGWVEKYKDVIMPVYDLTKLDKPI